MNEEEEILKQVQAALSELAKNNDSWKLIPEVASNLCYAKKDAKTPLTSRQCRAD